MTLTQKIITHRVFKNSQMDLRGCVSVRESFLSHDKWQIILLSEFFIEVTFKILWVTLSQKNNNLQGFKNSRMGLRGCVWAGAKFLKPWQVTDNIIEWIFMQFTFNILWVTLTQKIITHRVFNNSWLILRGYVWVRESFLNHDKWHIKLLSEFFPNSHSTFYEWL